MNEIVWNIFQKDFKVNKIGTISNSNVYENQYHSSKEENWTVKSGQMKKKI